MLDLGATTLLELVERLTPLKPVLSLNGAVVCRREKGRRPVYRLRYRDLAEQDSGADQGRRRRHVAIVLGGPDVAEAVRFLIGEWKAQRRMEEHVAAHAAADARAREKREYTENRRMYQDLGGGGRRRRRRVGEAYDQAKKQGGMALLTFLLAGPHLNPNRRPGRPRSHGLAFSLPSISVADERNQSAVNSARAGG